MITSARGSFRRPLFNFGIIVAASLALMTSAAFAQTAGTADFPNKPVKLIAGSAPGGSGDVVARALGEALSSLWKQSVVIENRAGAGGTIAIKALLAAPGDGYTLLVAAGSYLTISPFTQAALPYDVERDLTLVGFMAEIPIVIAASAKLPFQSINDLITYAKANPGKVTFAANTPGTFPHLATELLAMRAGVSMTHVPYKGSSEALSDVLSARTDLVAEGLGALAGGISSGGLRALGVTSARRLPSLPDVQAIGESVPGYAAVGFYAIVGPANMPPSLVRKLNEDINRVLSRPDVSKRLADLGSYVRAMTPEELNAFVKSERDTYGPLVKQLGLSAK